MESTEYSNEIKCLACGPILQARRYGAYNVNGYKFRTMAKDEGMKIRYSGVYISSNTRNDEPYILASEAHLVYYVDNEVDKE
ncbi:hypothetical protein AHAS_Ahas14G0189100 [Arachis hypogaea]